MRRTLGLSLLVVGAAAALIVGSYSALAGAGPVATVAGAVTGADEPDDGDAAQVAGADDVDGDDVQVQDADGDDGGSGAEHIAQVIADAFNADAGVEALSVSQEDVLTLHEQGIGFGALFKLYALAAAMGDDTSVDDLLAAIATDAEGKYEFAFGKLRNDLDEDQTAALEAVLESGPKNLGKAVSDSKKDVTVATVASTDDGDEDDGQGPPDHAPAHGLNRD